jgi:hypothetical protein
MSPEVELIISAKIDGTRPYYIEILGPDRLIIILLNIVDRLQTVTTTNLMNESPTRGSRAPKSRRGGEAAALQTSFERSASNCLVLDSILLKKLFVKSISWVVTSVV